MAAVPSIGRASAVEARPAAPEADLTRALYERHGRQIFTYCLHQLGNREEAEDATQTTFMNAFRGLQRGVVPELESAWLFKIANNVILTRRRSTSRRRRVETPGDLDAIQDLLPSRERDADELIRLTDALSGMPDQQRRALLLREWQGLSYREIGDQLGLSQAAVETLLFRARRSLAQGLTDPEATETKRRGGRLRGGLDFGSVLAGLKGLLGGGAAIKAAATAAVVASSAVVATDPALHHRTAPVPATAAPAATVKLRPAAPAPTRALVGAVVVPASTPEPAAHPRTAVTAKRRPAPRHAARAYTARRPAATEAAPAPAAPVAPPVPVVEQPQAPAAPAPADPPVVEAAPPVVAAQPAAPADRTRHEQKHEEKKGDRAPASATPAPSGPKGEGKGKGPNKTDTAKTDTAKAKDDGRGGNGDRGRDGDGGKHEHMRGEASVAPAAPADAPPTAASDSAAPPQPGGDHDKRKKAERAVVAPVPAPAAPASATTTTPDAVPAPTPTPAPPTDAAAADTSGSGHGDDAQRDDRRGGHRGKNV